MCKKSTLGSQRTVVMDSNFFLGYKKTCLKPEEVLISILIPFSSKVCVSVCILSTFVNSACVVQSM